MIGMRTILQVADNSGARRLSCILPLGGDVGLQAGLGDVVTAAVKEAAPDSAIPKGKVVKCVIVRMRKEQRRRAYAARGDLCRIRMASLRGLAFRGEDCDGSAGGGHGDRNL